MSLRWIQAYAQTSRIIVMCALVKMSAAAHLAAHD
jgi:hypothetical protein